MMPSLGSETAAVDASHLCDVLRGLRPGEATPVVLDCREEASYLVSHIRGAVHVALPTLLVRRLAAGKASIGQVAKHLGAEVRTGVLLYDHDGVPTPVVVALANRMLQEGCPVQYLSGEGKFEGNRSSSTNLFSIAVYNSFVEGHFVFSNLSIVDYSLLVLPSSC